MQIHIFKKQTNKQKHTPKRDQALSRRAYELKVKHTTLQSTHKQHPL